MQFLDILASVSRAQKVIAGSLGLIVLAALGLVLLISPKLDERARLRSQNESLRTEVRQARTDEANLRPFRRQAEALRNRLAAAKERLPSDKEMPRLYRQLTDLVAQTGLQLAVFAPKPPVDLEDVAEVPIAMTCEGSYHQLGAFFSRVSQLPRIVDLGDFRLLGIERPTGTLRAELTLGTYIFRAEGAPPPAAKPNVPPRPSGGAAGRLRSIQ